MENYFKIENIERDIHLTPTEGHDSTLIFLHGLGDSASGFLDVFDSPDRPIPNRMRVVLLTAPNTKVTINSGMLCNSWYDIKDFKRTEQSISTEEVYKNAERIKKVIDSEANKLNGNYGKVFLGGFSQGACMTLHIGLNNKERLGGLVVLSGLLFPFSHKDLDNDKLDLNIFVGTGKHDPLIQESHTQESLEPLKEKQFSNLFHKSYNQGHSICDEEMDDVKNFLINLI